MYENIVAASSLISSITEQKSQGCMDMHIACNLDLHFIMS